MEIICEIIFVDLWHALLEKIFKVFKVGPWILLDHCGVLVESMSLINSHAEFCVHNFCTYFLAGVGHSSSNSQVNLRPK